ncbi:spermidine/putrescine transport system ATP-binding protein [Arboricoccus pini]|uniref:Spermidine/putrescine transport system ATP-binding protein n=1 Tax=Arboricoccus pini TaxID=1963835 RepID=A0A212RJK0_9PROT|nr:ABC transporter ATP-binding protein [Arboricoccus pini]SNB72466.1 spermidine/putrescine transport system ATP-binding protein [Arboricoccus pini]
MSASALTTPPNLPKNRASGVNTPLVEVHELVKRFESFTALNNVSLRIGRSEFFTLLGPSGCGKTTLLRIIAGFEHPSAGALRLDGEDLIALGPNQRPINTVFQSYALFPHMNVRDNVAFGLSMLRAKPAVIAERVEEMLALVKLGHLADRRPAQLSGGQQQRVALARALAPRPRLLLLDEPLSALDFKLRKEMQFELKRLQRETNVTFVLVTHDQEEALTMSDRIAVMSEGLLQQVGTPEEIYETPANRFVADFIGEANLLAGRSLGRARDDLVMVRPERVSLKRPGPGVNGKAMGIVTLVTYVGADTIYETELPDSVVVKARMRDREDRFAPGDQVAIDWPDRAERMLGAAPETGVAA